MQWQVFFLLCVSNSVVIKLVLSLFLSVRCKKWGIPVEKIYNKTQREKFAWAIDMADEDFEF